MKPCEWLETFAMVELVESVEMVEFGNIPNIRDLWNFFLKNIFVNFVPF